MNTFALGTARSAPAAPLAHAHRLSRKATAFAAATAIGLGLAGCWDDSNDAPTTAFSIGGSVSGLTSAGLVLVNGADTATPAAGATSFSFPTPLASGSSYAVAVQAQPPNATCVVSSGIGTVGAAAVADISVTCTALGFTVGGSVAGLTNAGLVLANGADSVSVAANAIGFTLPTPVPQGATYVVSVKTQPSGEQCSLVQSTGTISGANVTNVAVTCAALTHTLGGTISGLASSGLVLGNGSDRLSPASGALSFTFPSPVAEGGGYAVSVVTQPSGETCSVGSGLGTMGTANVGNVSITCAANAYHVGGAISGLTSAGLILANGTDTVSPAVNAASYVFANRVAFGGTFGVTVQQQPAGLTCAVAGTFPATMGTADVTNADVTCTPSTGLNLVVGQLSCPFATPSADGNGASASVPAGEGMVFDGLGNLYVTGQTSRTVRKITPAGDVITIAGQYGIGGSTDGTGSAARFFGPQGIALDASGNLYVGDAYVMRKVTQAGVVTTLAGLPSSPGFVDGTGSAARFNQIRSVVADSAGNAYIADTGNNVIRKMTPAGVVTTFAGGGSAGGTAAGFVDGTGTTARFAAPGGLAIDAAGNIYVADYLNWSIRKITPTGVVSTLAGGGPTNPGFADGVGVAARFGGSSALAMTPGGGLYVLDQSFAAVRLVSATGIVTTLGNSGLTPTGPISATTFTWPASVAQIPGIGADSAGNLVLSAGCAVLKVGP